MKSADQATANAFAQSWNHLPQGSVYTTTQFDDWMAPLTRVDIEGKQVAELGCGNASLLVHCCRWAPARIVGVDLGDSVTTARQNVSGFPNAHIEQADLVEFRSPGFDVVYCIGVLHHLKDPRKGFESVVANTRPGGRFHCWVYAREGNGIVIHLVDPIRKFASRMPWWVNKYLIATPLVAPYYLYAKMMRALHHVLPTTAPKLLARAPLGEYSLWIAQREFSFFRHVAFDQLVTPQTVYIGREVIEEWLASRSEIEPGTSYVIMRNGNSWKFGARISPEVSTAMDSRN